MAVTSRRVPKLRFAFSTAALSIHTKRTSPKHCVTSSIFNYPLLYLFSQVGVGPGCLALPYAFTQAGAGLSTFFLIIMSMMVFRNMQIAVETKMRWASAKGWILYNLRERERDYIWYHQHQRPFLPDDTIDRRTLLIDLGGAWWRHVASQVEANVPNWEYCIVGELYNIYYSVHIN